MKTTFNLLPLSSRIRHEQRRQSKLWIGAWLSLLGLIALVHAWLGAVELSLKADLRASESRAEPVRQLHAQLQQWRRNSDVQREHLNRLADVAQSDVPLAVLQTLGSACATVRDQVRLDLLRVDEAVMSPPSGSNEPTVIRKQVFLTGKADADASLAGFVAALRGAGLFESVELESIQSGSQRETPHRSFQIRCQLDCPRTASSAAG